MSYNTWRTVLEGFRTGVYGDWWPVAALQIGTNVIMYALNVYWFSLMASGIKALLSGKRAPKAKKG
jgi:hypothetical protein